MTRRWKIEESLDTEDQWYIYSRRPWWPFWMFHDVRSGIDRAAARIVELKHAAHELFS